MNSSALKAFVFINKYGNETIDFSNPKAVKILNKTLLKTHYNIKYWNFPDQNLCPPIPGRVSYINHLSNLIAKKKEVKILDIGTGATCIYPLLGNSIFNWSFIGTDIDIESLQIAIKIVKQNKLNQKIQFRLQKNKHHILKGIIKEDDFFDAIMCNPPFFKSKKEALEANFKKQKGLSVSSKKKIEMKERNFSGKSNELWCKGGEKAFLNTYLYESTFFKEQCTWFTSLVSKKENVKGMYVSLSKLKATNIKTIEMKQGNKITRIVAWKF